MDDKVKEEARLDRMENHLKLMKESINKINDDSTKISNALIGNEYTGNIGIVHRMRKLELDVEKNKDEIAIIKDNIGLVKWFASGVGGLVIAIIIYLIEKFR